MNEGALFGGGKRNTEPFGKDSAQNEKGLNVMTEQLFRIFLDETTSCGDPVIDTARTDYLALEAFSQVAGDSRDTKEMERLKAQIELFLKRNTH